MPAFVRISCLSAVIATSCFADLRSTVSGSVMDAFRRPLDKATVLIWEAGVKKGYSTFCPTCYVDCGKRAITDANGSYEIEGLDPDLKFNLLVVREGYVPTFLRGVDPSAGTADITMKVRQPVPGSAVAIGRIVNSAGQPLADAVVRPLGVMFDTGKGFGSAYGSVEGLDPVAVTNDNGEFEIAFIKPVFRLAVHVAARGMAPAINNTLASGVARQTIRLDEGVTVRGRLVRDGAPVGYAEVGLYPREHAFGPVLKIIGFPTDELRVGTQADGSFAFTNVPAGVEWYVYGRIGSIANDAAASIVEFTTKSGGELVNVGEIQVSPGLQLTGRVFLGDGKSIVDGMRVTIASNRAFDSQTVVLPPDGRFRFKGLRPDDYMVFASVKGYRLASPEGAQEVPITLQKDTEGFELKLVPVAKR